MGKKSDEVMKGNRGRERVFRLHGDSSIAEAEKEVGLR